MSGIKTNVLTFLSNNVSPPAMINTNKRMEKNVLIKITALAMVLASLFSFGNTTACSNRKVENDENGLETESTKANKPKASGKYNLVNTGEKTSVTA